MSDHHENILEAILDEIQESNRKLSHIIQQNNQILAIVSEEPPLTAQSATLAFDGKKGGEMANILVGGTITALYQEWSQPNGSGVVVAPTGAVGYASDNPAVATVDPVSGLCTGVAAGTCNITGNDAGLAGPGLPASAALTVAAAPPPVAVSSTLTFQ